MNKKIPYIFYSLLTVCMSFHLPAYAQGTDNPPAPQTTDDAGGKGPGHRPIPKEAMDACSGKAAGDACSFTGRMNNTVEGTCRTPPRAEGQVVCMPKPPKEAFDACKGKAEGDACTFTGRKGTAMSGNCKKPPVGGEEMVCRPAKPPKPEAEQGPTPPAAK